MNRYSKEDKARWLAEYKDSGLSAKAFCRDKPFSQSTFSYWKKEAKQGKNKSNSFIELIPSEESTKGQICITYPSGVIVEINQIPSISVLKQLIGC